MTRRKILIVEDDLSILRAMRLVLEAENYEVIEAVDGDKGLEVLERGPLPDVILLDFMMPRKNGWEFIDALRATPRFASIPVVVVSAYDEIARTLKHCRAFVPKPVQLERLLSAVEECVA